MRFSTLAIILASASSILAAPGIVERGCDECDDGGKGDGERPPPPFPGFGGQPPPPFPGFGGQPPPPSPYFVPPPYYPTPYQPPPPPESGSACSGLESTPLCCQLDVEGIIDTPCKDPGESVHTSEELNEACGETGYTGMCCLLPILGDGLLCSPP